MSFIFEVSQKDEGKIRKAIELLTDLNFPFSNSIRFSYYKGYRKFGYCMKDKTLQSDYLVRISQHISEEKFINTTIHEILHTIPNEGFTSHKGNWKKWSDIVSTNTKYKITVSDSCNKIKDERPRETCYCPLCLKNFSVLSTKIDKFGKTDYCCNKCFKPIYSILPESPLKQLSIVSRASFTEEWLEHPALDSLKEILIYADVQTTRKALIKAIETFAISSIYTMINSYIQLDKVFRKKLAKRFLSGEVNPRIMSNMDEFAFINLFALTDEYLDVCKEVEKKYGEY